jgi:hypothetical protein
VCYIVKTAVGRTIVSLGLLLGKIIGEKLQCMKPDLVDIRLHFVLGHLFFGVVVDLEKLTNKVEGFGLFQEIDFDILAFLVLFVELMANDGRWDPCLIEHLCHISALFCCDLAPLCVKVC